MTLFTHHFLRDVRPVEIEKSSVSLGKVSEMLRRGGEGLSSLYNQLRNNAVAPHKKADCCTSTDRCSSRTPIKLKLETLFFKAVPYLNFMLLVVSAYVLIWHVVPFACSSDGMITSQVFQLEIVAGLLAGLALICYTRAWLCDPGPVPEQWVEWVGFRV